MTHSEIISLWPSLADFACDLSIPYGTAKAMRRRDSIPPQYWNAVVLGASERSIDGVGLQQLADAVSNSFQEVRATEYNYTSALPPPDVNGAQCCENNPCAPTTIYQKG